ncbi:MAG: aspartate aminotransferase family protein [Chitinophagales bacterium]|nr:aspartate aminotransferase family protein [Chitinophagales bacterium]
MSEQKKKFPQAGDTVDALKNAMREARQKDARWQDGKTFSMVFYPGEEVAKIQEDAYRQFFFENGLNPSAFPSLRKFETEVVAMSADLVHGDGDVAGNMTSGGTESILCAVKAAKEWWLEKSADVILSLSKDGAGFQPEMIIPLSAHPAFDKAANYFGIKIHHAPLRDDYRVDVEEVKKLVNANTVLIVGSAPAYPHGVIDPIEDLAKLALEKNVLLHVDACVGGYILPFVERLGYPLPKFDFRVAGVTSMSMDLHKYGYITKGASVVLYRNSDIRKKQYFVYIGWPGGIYASPSVSGSRGGGAIAAAWATMNFLGIEGYLKMAKAVMDATDKIKERVNEIEGIHLVGNPDACVFAITSDKLDIFGIGDELTLKGWHIDRQQNPGSLHFTISYGNTAHIDTFLTDLEAAVKKMRKPSIHQLTAKATIGLVKGASKVLSPKAMSRITSKFGRQKKKGIPQRSAAMYGMMAALPNKGDIREIIVNMLDGLNKMD